MARTATGQVSARGFASSRALMAAALIAVFGYVAEPNRVAAQFAPTGPVQQPQYPSYSPFPSPTPPPAQAETPARAPAVRADEERRAQQYRIRRQAADKKRQLLERKRQLARKQQSVERKQKAARKKESRKKVAASHENQRQIAESKGYKPVSDLVNFPKFFPGLGIIYVKPDTLPVGPFLCFDREDRLVATVYMVPIKDIDDHKTLDAAGVSAPVDHVSFYFNPGHPGVMMPHYHFVIWHVSKKDEARVAQ